MKAFIAILALALVAHVDSTDWKEELLSQRIDLLNHILQLYARDLQRAAGMSGKGFLCTKEAVSKFESTLLEAKAQYKNCVYQNDDKSEALKCIKSFAAIANRQLLQDYERAYFCIKDA